MGEVSERQGVLSTDMRNLAIAIQNLVDRSVIVKGPEKSVESKRKRDDDDDESGGHRDQPPKKTKSAQPAVTKTATKSAQKKTTAKEPTVIR